MKRFGFLIPAAVAGPTLATLAVVFKLDATATYVLFGVIAVLVVCGGIVRDLYGLSKRKVVVKVHQAAVAAEKHDGSEASLSAVKGEGERLTSGQPLVIPARRAGLEILRLKKLNERVEFRIVRHLEDPMPPRAAE